MLKYFPSRHNAALHHHRPLALTITKFTNLCSFAFCLMTALTYTIP